MMEFISVIYMVFFVYIEDKIAEIYNVGKGKGGVSTMRVLRPKENQTYLYFYEDSDLNPSQNISAVRKLLKELGCKIGPVWKRQQPAFYLCSCDKGEFKLVNDVPAIFIESEDSQLIEHLAIGLERVCHRYKAGDVVRLKNGEAVTIEEYINEDYLVAGVAERRISEDDIVCKKKIPDGIIGKKIKVAIIDPDFGEFEKYEGIVIRSEMIVQTMSVTIEVVYNWDLNEGEEPTVFEKIILEDEIKNIELLGSDC